jgi:hypothetical protein
MDAYICCPGPSLRYLNPEVLNKPNVLKIALNNAYPYVRPDIWFGMDHPHCYNRSVFWEPFIKVMRGGYQHILCEGRELKDCFNLYFADLAEGPRENIFNIKEDMTFIWQGNVVASALQIILWMGVKRIHLIGCDLSLDKGDYHDRNIKLSERNKSANALLYKELVEFWKFFSNASSAYGVEVISCTPDSKINDYLTYLPVAEALKRTEACYNIPTRGELIHSKDIEL